MPVIVLAIDTALSACSVAITRGEDTLACHVELMARGQAERLAPLVAEVLAESNISFDQIDIIGVTRGPGAFTGLRVGLAFARGLALALDKPCIGLSTLEVLAKASSQPKTLAAINMAGSLFVGAWDTGMQVVAPYRSDLTDLLAKLEGEWTLTGPGLAPIQELRPNWPTLPQNVPDPVMLAQLARRADPATHAPDPLYLRGVDAKLAGGVS